MENKTQQNTEDMELLKECVACIMTNQIMMMKALNVEEKRKDVLLYTLMTSKLRNQISPGLKEAAKEDKEIHRAVNRIDDMLDALKRLDSLFGNLR